MSARDTTHRVRTENRPRVRCQQPGCAAPADMCESVYWNTGNTTGVSFFYFCAGHAAFIRAGVRGPAEAARVSPVRP